jgi:curved DNA-binding protein
MGGGAGDGSAHRFTWGRTEGAHSPGAQSRNGLRVRGKGIPANPPGDLQLDIQVVLPPANTPKARELYETMVRELAFKPRPDRRS